MILLGNIESVTEAIEKENSIVAATLWGVFQSEVFAGNVLEFSYHSNDNHITISPGNNRPKIVAICSQSDLENSNRIDLEAVEVPTSAFFIFYHAVRRAMDRDYYQKSCEETSLLVKYWYRNKNTTDHNFFLQDLMSLIGLYRGKNKLKNPSFRNEEMARYWNQLKNDEEYNPDSLTNGLFSEAMRAKNFREIWENLFNKHPPKEKSAKSSSKSDQSNTTNVLNLAPNR